MNDSKRFFDAKVMIVDFLEKKFSIKSIKSFTFTLLIIINQLN